MINGVLSPVVLGGAEDNFGSAFIINNLQFVVLASAVLRDVFTDQQIINFVLPSKEIDAAETIAKAAISSNPAIRELHVAVFHLK